MPVATLASAPAAPVSFPSVPLQVPTDIAQSLADAVGSGISDATAFAQEHESHERWLVSGWALLQMKWPSLGDAQQSELRTMHAIAGTRTPEQTATAAFYAKHGMTDAWEQYLTEYTRGVGPAQAKAAAKLLHDTLNMVHQATQVAKSAAGRKRPYDVDPTLSVALEKPGGSPSYPSGHTSAAFAAAIVLGYLMPQRAQEFLNIAAQAAFARVYGGVHFPSDVVAGARLASTIASYNCMISGLGGFHTMTPAQSAHPKRRRRPRALPAAA